MPEPAMPEPAMPEPAMPEPAGTGPAAAPGVAARGGTLGLRLALAFLVVALAAVALVAGLTATFAAADVSTLASQQRAQLANAIAVAAGAVWGQNNTWASADLSPVLDLAARTGEAVQIRDQAGHVVVSSPGFDTAPGPQSSPAVVVRGDGVTEPTPAELGSLRDEVLRLARMVGDLQTLAAADAAALNLARRPCDLAGLAAAAADSLARRFEAAGITLDRRLAASPVLADPHWLHQVITNLLTNALKFTPVGGHVTISTGPSGANVILQVSDTGPGIPADDLPRIFDRFWRGQRAAQVSGSGIGLAVAAELAQAHGGRLTAGSQLGRGTEMTLTLPGS